MLDKTKRYLVVGLGLLGGKYALELTRAGFHVDGINRSEGHLQYALEHGYIAGGKTHDFEDLVRQADHIIFGLYPTALLDWFRTYGSLLKPGCIFTDVSGVKTGLVEPVQALCPGSDIAELLDKPNNNLAVEYCKAILELGVSMTPVPLPRQGAGHGEALSPDAVQFASASALRQLWQSGGADAAAPYVPAAVLPLYREAYAAGRYTDFDAAGRCELALLRAKCTGPEPFANLRGVSEGLEHRLEHAVRTSSTHQELLDALTTVRYPRARMRRLAMDAALGYDAALPPLPPYLHLLGARREALSLLKGAVLPVSHSLMRLREEEAPCARMADAQLAASDLGALCRKTPEPMGGLLRQKIVFLTK